MFYLSFMGAYHHIQNWDKVILVSDPLPTGFMSQFPPLSGN
jgi:hypothetical protein